MATLARPHAQPCPCLQMAEWDAIYEHHTGQHATPGGRPGYVFATNNPFAGDPAALEKGKDL